MSMERLEEAQKLAERAVTLAPSEPTHLLLLAQVHIARDDYPPARTMLLSLTDSTRPEIREQAGRLMAHINTVEQQRRASASRPAASSTSTTTNNAERIRPDLGERTMSAAADGTIFLTRKPRDGEQRVFGTLVRVECSPRETVFHLKNGTEVLRFLSAHPETIQLISFRQDLKKMECGTHDPADPVFVTFRPMSTAETPAANNASQAPAGGEVVAIEFMPAGYIPKDPK